MRRERPRRGNWENDILAILLFAAKVGDDQNRKTPTGQWVTLEELSLRSPYGVNIPRSTLNYIFWYEGKGIVIRERKDAKGKNFSEVHESVVDRIAAKYGIHYKIRRVHVYGDRREPCECGNPTDEWEISATFVEPPKDAEWERFVERTINGEVTDPDGSSDQGFDGERT